MHSPSAATSYHVDLTLRDVKGNDTQLREGVYGKVLEVEYAGTSLAAQVFQIDQGVELSEKFLQECRIWSAARHPNIVQLIGVWYRDDIRDNPFPATVTETMSYDLRSLVENRDDALKIKFHQKMLILHDVSKGLWYLHSQNPTLVHGGLTPSNILLGCSQNYMKAKITNVGVAKVIKAADYTFESGFLPLEAMNNDPHYEPPFDIFSFGMVFWYTAVDPNLPELSEHNKSNAEFRELQKSLDAIKAGGSTHLIPLLKSCLDRIPDNRPSIVELSDTIKDLLKQTAKYGIESTKQITIPELYKETFRKNSNEKALYWKDKDDDQWQGITYAEYEKLIYNVAKSFLELGLKPCHAVGILGFNSVEWFASSIGAVFAGGRSTGIYSDSSQELCQHILKDCKANIAVVENAELLEKIVGICDQLPHLKAIVQYKGKLSKGYPSTYTWEKFLEVGKDREDSVIDNIINNQQPNQCAIVLYTSGTTSNPKGVMLSHDNLTWSTMAFLDTVDIEGATKSAISYLSPAHIIGMFADMFLPIPAGGTVWFANSNAIESSLISAMQEVQPTFLFSTPRVWEKIKQRIEALMLEHRVTSQRPKGISSLNKIIKDLGLDKCKYISVGGESMHKETLKYFYNMKLTVLGYYGMSESTLPLTTNLEGAMKFGSCGRSTKGVQVEIINTDEYKELQLLCLNQPENDIGEVVCRGRNVFMGYLNMEEKTKETIDDEGWLHSGDIGWLDDDNFLHIVCRVDDVISLVGGQKIVPIGIEGFIKSEIDFLCNVVLIGDSREYLTCLLTLKCDVDPDTGEVTDFLHPQVIKTFQEELGTNCTTLSQVIETNDSAVYKVIQDGIDRYNKYHTFSESQKIRYWRLLETDFTVVGGELGPVLKLKRSIVMLNYAEIIEEMYGPGCILKNQEVCVLKDTALVSQKCTHYGKVIGIQGHNTTVEIPKGAIEKGYSVEVKAAVSLFGPHKLPKGYTRISPYVWIGASYNFKKPLKIEVEHHAVVSKEEHISQLCVMEACKENGSEHCIGEYKMCEATQVYSSHCERRSPFYTYHTYSTYTCIAKKSEEIADEVAVYQFLPVDYTNSKNFFIEICFCCNLKYLRKLTEDNYKLRNMVKDEHNCSIVEVFKDQQLQLHLHSKEMHVSHVGQNKISTSEIIYQRFQDSRREDDRLHYPPCFRVRVDHQNLQTQLNIKFEICVRSKELLSTLTLLVPAAVGYSQMEQSSFETLLPVQHVSSDQSLPVGERMEIASKAHSATVEPAAMDDTEPVVKDVPESEPLNVIPSKQAVEEPLYTEDYLKSKHQEDKTDVNFLQYDELTEKQRRVISDTQAIIVVVNPIEFMATMCYLKPRNGLEHVLKTERGTKVGPDSLIHPLWFGDFGKCPVVVIRVKAGHGHHAVSHADKDTFPKVKLIVGVGVAAGFRENGVKLGDVLVSNRIQDCDQYKKKNGKDIPRGNIKNACSLMLQRLQEPFQWMYPCTQDKQRYCEIKPGLILSKPVLMDDKEERKRLLQYFGEEAKGYEMEGFGIMQSSINCIIVKGVCDYAGEKTDGWQPTAALAANDYLQHHFRQDLSILLEKKQDQSSQAVYVLAAIIVVLVGIIIVLLLKG